MPRPWCWCATASVALALLIAVPTSRAATVLERVERIAVAADGTFERRIALDVRLDSADDVDAWRVYRIALDHNRTLAALDAAVLTPDGRRLAVPESDRRTVWSRGAEAFHSSRSEYHVRFRELVPGARVTLLYTLSEAPYFPAATAPLGSAEPIERLEVTVTFESPGTGADEDGEEDGHGGRWRLDGARDGLELETLSNGVRVTGRSLAPVLFAPLAPRRPPRLRFGWGPYRTWGDVAVWYRQVLAELERAPPEVRAQARELVDGLDDPRERLDVLADFLGRKVRYVAVEVGTGGYRPSPPAETLERRWGDCKDKTLLLLDLLESAGITAFPALLRTGERAFLDLDFPSLDQLNHMIVAVPAAGLRTDAEDPIADGYLFVDPTLRRGAGRWLHPQAQDRPVLVLEPGGAALARTPLRPRLERRSLRAELAVEPSGDAAGTLTLTLRGRPADTLLAEIEGSRGSAEEAARALFASLLPGTALARVGLEAGAGALPEVTLTAEVEMPGLVQGAAGRRSLRLSGLRALPEPRLLDGRAVDVVLPIRAVDSVWRLALPSGWCPPVLGAHEIANEVGTYRTDIARDAAGRLVVSRTFDLGQRWVEPPALPLLSDLAIAEDRAHRRRIRLRCD